MNYFKVKRYLLREQWYVVRKYYRNAPFAIADLVLSLGSFFVNPYRACRRVCEKSGEDQIHIYGETPIRTFEEIAKRGGLGPEDRYLELGSGRGKTCFWASAMTGCSSWGVERVRPFVLWGRTAAWISKLPVQFAEKDFFSVDFASATFIYLYAIHLSEERVEKLIAQMSVLPAGSRLVVVGMEIRSKFFTSISVFRGVFPWGNSNIYIYIV